MKRFSGALLAGKKPKSLSGGINKKERQKFKAEKGIVFSQRKKELPDLLFLYKKLSRIKRQGTVGFPKARFDFFVANFFSSSAKKNLLFLGYNPPMGEKKYAPVFHRLHHCSVKELKKIRQAANELRKELRSVKKIVSCITLANGSLHNFPEEAALVGHNYDNFSFAFLGYLMVIDSITSKRLAKKQ